MIASSILSVALSTSLLGLPALSAPVVTVDAPPIPNITADRWIVYDADAEVVIASWNANHQAAMASVTKVMTAILVVENADLNEQMSIPSLATNARGSTAGLVAGEVWTVGDLLIAMLVRSGNDAALALAYHVGGESVSTFVAMMNSKASAFGMNSTSFANPNGLDHDDHYSTAQDLLTLIIESQTYPDVKRIGSIKIVSMPGPDGQTRTFTNTNRLVGTYPGVVGLKTGDTPRADKVLLGVAERAGRTIYSVVMHSDNHFADTRELIDWAYSTYSTADRWLRVFYSQDGAGSSLSSPVELSEGHERRLRALPTLDDGQWRVSSIVDLPKAESISRWIREALPSVVGGE
jgi:D-alanyl-D-alanine carboxypeptidase